MTLFASTHDTPRREREEIWAPHGPSASGLTRHGACGRVWWQSGNETSHCGRCHLTFTSLAAFDTHQRQTDDGSVCMDPRVDLRFGVRRPTGAMGETVAGYWALLGRGTDE